MQVSSSSALETSLCDYCDVCEVNLKLTAYRLTGDVGNGAKFD